MTSQPTKPSSGARAGSYEVGYRKPPAHARFKPGQSGNAKGRPARSKGGRQLLRQALNTPITVTEGGLQRSMTQQEVMFKSLMARAIKGEPRAVALVVKLMEQYGMMQEIVDRVKITVQYVGPGDKLERTQHDAK